MDWEQFSKRKRVTLESFLFSTTDLQEALKRFQLLKVQPPSLEILTDYFTKRVAQLDPANHVELSVSEKVEVEKSNDDDSLNASSLLKKKSAKQQAIKTSNDFQE